MAQKKAKTVNELYRDRTLYTSRDMFSPPAERLPHVIRFELTTGCNWGRCTYCGGFDGIGAGTKSQGEYQAHVETVFGRMNPALKSNLGRIFIGGGNALDVRTKTLAEAIDFTITTFEKEVGNMPTRTAMYGRTDAINRKGLNGLDSLHDASTYGGLDLIYWGVESGSNPVLRYVRKGCSQNDILKAARTIKGTGIDVSIMIMPGLGGMAFYDSHVRETARILGEISPKFLTFMGVNPNPRSVYARNMAQEMKEHKNRPLTDEELAGQMIAIISEMPAFETKVGCFPCSVDSVGHNPLNFGSEEIYDADSKQDLVDRLIKKIKPAH